MDHNNLLLLSAETKVEALIFNALFIAQARIRVNSKYECVNGTSRQEVSSGSC